MMKLPLDAAVLGAGAVDEVPIASCTAVVAPMRYGGHVAEDGIQRDFSLISIAEVFGPGVDLFLTRGIPRHLAAERIRLPFPAIRSFAHFGLDLISQSSHPLAPEVVQNFKKDIAFHLPETRVPWRELGHRQSRLGRVLQVPLRGMTGH